MEYRNLADEELIEIINGYIHRLEKLQAMIADFLKPTRECGVQAVSIYDEYKLLKEEIREISHYVGLVRNKKGSSLYTTVFRPAFQGASAYGMLVPASASINGKMLNAVEEAHYRLNKYLYLLETNADK